MASITLCSENCKNINCNKHPTNHKASFSNNSWVNLKGSENCLYEEHQPVKVVINKKRK